MRRQKRSRMSERSWTCHSLAQSKLTVGNGRLTDKKANIYNRAEDDLNDVAAKTVEQVNETEWIRGGYF